MEGEGPFVESLKGMRIGGRYVVDKVLGAGGMGIVATARYPELQQRVAIKFLRPEHATNELLNARFIREGRLAATVKSEHFVRVFDIGKLPTGVPYLVMELLVGRDVGDELAERGALPVDVAVDLVMQALVGLAEIHAFGIVHRDLKPSNLFIAEAAGKRMIKVLDFGISKESRKDAGAPLTSTEHVLGTPQYMSPEQVRAAKDVNARSDIWSLGVILYELLTAKRPFVSDEGAIGEVFAKIIFEEPAPPRTHRPDLPEALEAVILKCLSREPSARYETVAELAEALGPFGPPATVHRIESVHQALTARRSLVPNAEEASEDPKRLSQASTVSSSPSAKREQPALAFAPTSASDPFAHGAPSEPHAKPVTAMTSSSRSVSREPSTSRTRAIAIAVAALVVGAGGLVLLSRGPARTPAATPTITSIAETSAPTTVAPPASTAQETSTRGVRAALSPAAESSLAPPNVATATSPPRAPAVRASASSHTKPPSRPPGSPSPGGAGGSGRQTNDLILDRK